jgi:hypothetical protein
MKKPIIYVDLDGTVAGFSQGYKDTFNRDAFQDDLFTVNQFCLQEPHFFRFLPVLEKGAELVSLLKDDYKVIFLTTPMQGMDFCKRDKLDWVKEHFGVDYDVIFSDNKSEYVTDESSILIDDMTYNLKPWADAGGTAINIKLPIDKIFEIIEETLYGKKVVEDVKKQLENIVVNTNPSEKQKQQGNYKKGKIIFKKIPIMIENPKGSIRFGFDEKGRHWISRMKAHYGYILGKNDAADGDKVDCFIGPSYNKSLVFIVNQNTGDGRFDEHKCILGCNDLEEAKALYLANYEKGWESRIDSIVQTNTKKLRDWIANGNLNEPFK